MAQKVHLKKLEIKKIRQFLRILKKKGVRVSQAILFGSYAKGIPREDSDIDIAVISQQFGRDVTQEIMFLRKLALQIDSHIEPIPFSPKDFENRYSTLIREIKMFGKKLI